MFVYLTKTLEYKLSTLVENGDTHGLIETTRKLRRIKAIFFCKCFLDLLIIVTTILFYEPFAVIYLGLRTVGVDMAQIAQMKWGFITIHPGVAFAIYLFKYFFSTICVATVLLVDNSLSSLSFEYYLLFILVVLVRTLGADFITMVLTMRFMLSGRTFDDFLHK